VIKHIEYPRVPLQGLFEANVRNAPNALAIVFCAKAFSYLELDSMCNRFANTLLKLGVAKGDRVALYLPNIPQFVIAYFGALKAGAVVTPINPLYREREVVFQLDDSGAQTLVTLDTLRPVVEKIKTNTPLNHLITTRLDQHDFDEAINAPNSCPSITIDPVEALAALQYTGGTNGTAKAAMLTHQNLLSNALAFATTINATTKDIFLTALPLFHIYGMTTSLIVPISLGAKMVMLPKFEAAQACAAIQQHKVTVLCGVPTMYQLFLTHPDLSNYDLKSIRVCISGASPLPPTVQKRFMETTGGLLVEGYGLTEASPVTHCTPVEAALVRVGSIGVPLPDTEAKIVDLENPEKVLEVGRVGELAVRGPQVMRGYWNQPDETALVLRGGWLLTGDLACVDAAGYFYVVDRKKDLIKHKGYSVYPRELEDLLYEHPNVKLCAVVGTLDGDGNEVAKACVVLKDGVAVCTDELMRFINEKVASYKGVREIEFIEALPVSSVGKVLKNQLHRR